MRADVYRSHWGMALFGSSDDDLARRVEELERRVAALERARFMAVRHRTGSPSVSPTRHGPATR